MGNNNTKRRRRRREVTRAMVREQISCKRDEIALSRARLSAMVATARLAEMEASKQRRLLRSDRLAMASLRREYARRGRSSARSGKAGA